MGDCARPAFTLRLRVSLQIIMNVSMSWIFSKMNMKCSLASHSVDSISTLHAFIWSLWSINTYDGSCTWPVKSPGLFLTMYSAWYICFNVRGSSSTSTCSSFDKVKYRKLGLPYNIRCFGSFKRGLKTSFQHKLNSYNELWFVYYGTFIRLLIANFCIVFICKRLWTKASANSYNHNKHKENTGRSQKIWILWKRLSISVI